MYFQRFKIIKYVTQDWRSWTNLQLVPIFPLLTLWLYLVHLEMQEIFERHFLSGVTGGSVGVQILRAPGVFDILGPQVSHSKKFKIFFGRDAKFNDFGK